jgi:hypothetical protein
MFGILVLRRAVTASPHLPYEHIYGNVFSISNIVMEENMACTLCNDTGIIETGNNDLPCSCPAGSTALFNAAGVDGPITGAEVKRHFLNGSPEPIETGRSPIPASSLPGRT